MSRRSHARIAHQTRPLPARTAGFVRFASALALLGFTAAAPAAAQESAGEDAASVTAAPAAEPIVFRAARDEIEIVDGDSFWMGVHPVRLHGIDTVAPDQTCRRGAAEVDCYGETVKRLSAFLDDSRFRCEVHRGRDGKPRLSYGRYVATCHAGATEVNREMVRLGWALAARSSVGDGFRDLEADARAARRGLHALEFQAPWDFRRERRNGGG